MYFFIIFNYMYFYMSIANKFKDGSNNSMERQNLQLIKCNHYNVQIKSGFGSPNILEVKIEYLLESTFKDRLSYI